jgi:hypothetical protein
MKVGTKSVLFGAHCFFIHPIFVAWAWIKLYGFPFDPRIWISFLVHDWGYWGKSNMDGKEGESHPELGAKIMGWLFDRECKDIHCWKRQRNSNLLFKSPYDPFPNPFIDETETCPKCNKWSNFSKYHSRFYSKKDNTAPSKLCYADKLAVSIEPWWLYLPRVIITGEINEYMSFEVCLREDGFKTDWVNFDTLWRKRRLWHKEVQSFLFKWVYDNKDKIEYNDSEDIVDLFKDCKSLTTIPNEILSRVEHIDFRGCECIEPMNIEVIKNVKINTLN